MSHTDRLYDFDYPDFSSENEKQEMLLDFPWLIDHAFDPDDDLFDPDPELRYTIDDIPRHDDEFYDVRLEAAAAEAAERRIAKRVQAAVAEAARRARRARRKRKRSERSGNPGKRTRVDLEGGGGVFSRRNDKKRRSAVTIQRMYRARREARRRRNELLREQLQHSSHADLLGTNVAREDARRWARAYKLQRAPRTDLMGSDLHGGWYPHADLLGSGLVGGDVLDDLRASIDNENYEEFETLLFEDPDANVDIIVPYVLRVFNEIEDDARDYLIRLVEDAEADPNVVDEEGETAFTRAVMIGNKGYIYILNMYGELDVNIRNENGHTPLTLAVNRGDIDMVLFIMRNFNLEEHANGPPVIMAAKEGNADLVMNIMSNFNIEEEDYE